MDEAALLMALRDIPVNVLVIAIGDPDQLGAWVSGFARRSGKLLKKQLTSTVEHQCLIPGQHCHTLHAELECVDGNNLRDIVPDTSECTLPRQI